MTDPMKKSPPSSSGPPSPSDGRVGALDGLRGIAILLVLLHHTTNLPARTALDQVWSRIAVLGWSGVTLFFVLSGYLITGILLDEKGSQGYFRNFYARRALRILPLYYGVVALSLLVLPHIPHPKVGRFGQVSGDGLYYWAHVSNFLIAEHERFRHGILDVSWSLAIEEQFYLVWPFAVFLLGPVALTILCASLVASAHVFRILGLVAGAGPIATYVLPFGNLDALAVGALLALAARRGDRTRGASGLEGLYRAARILAPASIGVLFGIAIYRFWDSSGRFGGHWAVPSMRAIGYTLIIAASGSMVVLAAGARASAWRSVLERPSLQTLGKYSYAMYLFHLPLRALVRDWFYPPERYLTIAGSALPGQLIFYAMSLALTLGAAWLSWHLFERHFLHLKRYFHAGVTTRSARNRPGNEERTRSRSGGRREC